MNSKTPKLRGEPPPTNQMGVKSIMGFLANELVQGITEINVRFKFEEYSSIITNCRAHKYTYIRNSKKKRQMQVLLSTVSAVWVEASGHDWTYFAQTFQANTFNIIFVYTILLIINFDFYNQSTGQHKVHLAWSSQQPVSHWIIVPAKMSNLLAVLAQ